MLALSTGIKILLLWLGFAFAFFVGILTGAILAASKQGDKKAEGIKREAQK